MKAKTVKLILTALLLVATGFTKANAEATWLGNSAIQVNGTWYYAGNSFEWCTGGAFNGANLGILRNSFTLAAQSQVWETNNVNWNGGSVKFYYKIDDGADVESTLNWYKFENNNNFFQSGGSDFAAASIDISTLSYGSHTLTVWFNCDSKWDSNNGSNYVATFTRLPEGIEIDTDFSEGQTGYYYVKAPLAGGWNATKEITVDLTGWDYHGPIKVYDDGGKTGSFADNMTGGSHRNIIFRVSNDYVLQVTGTVDLKEYNFLTLYGSEGDEYSRMLGYSRYCNSYQANSAPLNNLGTLTSTQPALRINFACGDDAGTTTGFDLTVTPIKKTDSKDITISSVSGGSVTGSSSATVNTVVNLTATPDDGKMLNEVIVTDALGHKIDATGGWYSEYTNTASFAMPGSPVTVTPVFVDVANISVNIPHSNSESSPKEVVVPAGVSTFKVYDCGGPDKTYGYNDYGYLLITAPAGRLIELKGTVTCDTYSWMILYDGNTTSSSKMGPKTSYNGPSGDDIGTLLSSGNQVLVFFRSQTTYPSYANYDGVDLTVNIIDPSASHNITIVNNDENGSVSVASSTANINEQVVVTVTPDDGYLLNSLEIVDADNNKLESTGGVWYSGNLASATFAMPNNDVTITPKFALKSNGLSVNMPAKSVNWYEPFTVTLPEGINTFKVYDDGGPEGACASFGYNSYLLIKGRQGYTIHVTGTISTNGDHTYLRLHDSDSPHDNNLILGTFRGSNQSIDVSSTGPEMLMFFMNHGGTPAPSGFDVTVGFEVSSSVNVNMHWARMSGDSGYKSYYVATFYNEDQAYKLPEGCQAYIVKSDRSLCLIGDGTIVPANCPVLIISTVNYSYATLTATSETVTIPEGNALKPAKWDTQVTNAKVLYVESSGEIFGFFKFTGTIPAGKAYLE